jgi:hypothetical protein
MSDAKEVSPTPRQTQLAGEFTTSIIIRENLTDQILFETAVRDLSEVDLTGAKLAGAAMNAIERITPASGHRIHDMRQSVVDLHRLRLASSDLSRAVFSNALVTVSDFSRATLCGAAFVRTQFIRVDFTDADLTHARFWHTAFVDCATLHLARGLESVQHFGPSSLDARTLRASIDKLPLEFLLGVGYTAEEVTALRKLYRRAQFYSCFISYARSDAEFAARLRKRLIKNDISCWQDTHDLLGGDFWRRQIDEAIEKHDKLVLVCSEASLERPAVIAEILDTIDRERRTRVQKLFPIRIDDYVLSDALEQVAKQKVISGEWRENWVSYVRAYHIPDFSAWRNAGKFSAEVKRFLQALQHPPMR